MLVTDSLIKVSVKMPATSTNTKPKSRPRVVRYVGINADARALGVHRVTLYRVLTGEWKHLPGLRRRYEALKRQQQEAAAQ